MHVLIPYHKLPELVDFSVLNRFYLDKLGCYAIYPSKTLCNVITGEELMNRVIIQMKRPKTLLVLGRAIEHATSTINGSFSLQISL